MSNNLPLPNTGVNNPNLISNRYLLKQSLDAGSFGEVFLADDLKFNPPRVVAIKRLLSQFLNDPEVRADIEREASALARFNHPNILRVIDFDISPNQAYIVMELAEGGSLGQKIRPNPTQPPVGLPLAEVAWYLEQICDGLDEAHNAGLIHRDLKPFNILLDKRGHPLIADFGQATAIKNNLNNPQSSVVLDTTIIGTPAYMAPEQWLGQVSRASDIYAMGVITYQMITGRLPFHGTQDDLALQHTTAPIPKLKDRAPNLNYPPGLDEVIAGAMAKNPRQRIRPAMEFYRRFKAAIDHHFGAVLAPAVTNNPTQPAVPPATSTVASVPVAGLVIPPARPPTQIVARPVTLFKTLIGHTSLVLSIAFSPDGKTLASSSYDETIKLWDVDSGTLVTTLSDQSERSDGVWSVAFSPDGKTLAADSENKTIKLWNVDAGKVMGNFSGHAGAILSVAFSRSGRILASGSWDNTVKLWDVTHHNLIHTLSGHSHSVLAVAFSPDGKTLASASTDKTVILWNASSGQVLNTLTGHTSDVRSVAFSPAGTLLASASNDKTIKLWDMTSGKLMANLFGHTDQVSSVAFSSDGKLLASASWDDSIKLWDMGSGRLITTLSGHSSTVSCVIFSPYSKMLVSSSFDKTIKLWQLNL